MAVRSLAAKHLQPCAGRDAQCMPTAVIFLAAALRNLQAAVGAPLVLFAAQDDHRVGAELGYLQGKGLLLDGGDFMRHQGGEILALKSLQELVQHLTIRAHAIAVAVTAMVVIRQGAQERDAVDEDALRAHLGGRLQQQAVG